MVSAPSHFDKVPTESHQGLLPANAYFVADGFLAPLIPESSFLSTTDHSEPKTPIKVTRKIPQTVLQNAAGIAVFSCMRSGLWLTGSGGSGILIARKSDGTWSPPSGIMLHTPTLSFIIGVDVYDCVLVVSNLAALESITRPRVIFGEEVVLRTGPLVTVDSNESEPDLADLENGVLTYVKARGLHRDVNLIGSILTERSNENERFYANDVTQMDILAGNVTRHVAETQPLFEVIKLAEGRTDFDSAVIKEIAREAAPGDATIATPKSASASPHSAFGLPNASDPDPYGVLALEMAGLEIREAGSRLRPPSSQFDMMSHPASPIFSKFPRQSIDTYATRSNRGSCVSNHTTKSRMSDAGTQTNVNLNTTPQTTPSPGQPEFAIDTRVDSVPEVKEVKEMGTEVSVAAYDGEDEDGDDADGPSYASIDAAAFEYISPRQSLNKSDTISAVLNLQAAEQDSDRLAPYAPNFDHDSASKASSNYEKSDYSDDDDENVGNEESDDAIDADDADDEDDDTEPVIFEVAEVQPARTQVIVSRVIQAKGSVVTIPKRLPPPLPTRSPARLSRASRSDMGGDVSHLRNLSVQTISSGHLTLDPSTEPTVTVLHRLDDDQPTELYVPVASETASIERMTDGHEDVDDEELSQVLVDESIPDQDTAAKELTVNDGPAQDLHEESASILGESSSKDTTLHEEAATLSTDTSSEVASARPESGKPVVGYGDEHQDFLIEKSSFEPSLARMARSETELITKTLTENAADSNATTIPDSIIDDDAMESCAEDTEFEDANEADPEDATEFRFADQSAEAEREDLPDYAGEYQEDEREADESKMEASEHTIGGSTTDDESKADDSSLKSLDLDHTDASRPATPPYKEMGLDKVAELTEPSQEDSSPATPVLDSADPTQVNDQELFTVKTAKELHLPEMSDEKPESKTEKEGEATQFVAVT